MRFSKSLLLALCFCSCFAQAQDTTIVEDTIFVNGKEATVIFHADKPTGAVVLHERAVPESTLQHLRSDDAFWYANKDFKKKAAKPARPSFFAWLFSQGWFYSLMWILIIGSCIAVMVLFLAKSNISFFRKKPTTISSGNDPDIPENIFSIDYNAEIKKAVAQTNFRLAIRLHFLETLAMLSQKGAIQFQEGATNSDYLQQLRPTTFYTTFKKLIYQFEYAWYGQFKISPEQYGRIETDFTNFKTGMGI